MKINEDTLLKLLGLPIFKCKKQEEETYLFYFEGIGWNSEKTYNFNNLTEDEIIEKLVEIKKYYSHWLKDYYENLKLKGTTKDEI